MEVQASIEQHRRVLDALSAEVAALTDADLVRPTPCVGWTMHDVLFHIAVALDLFEQMACRGSWDLDDVDFPTISSASDARVHLATRSQRSLSSWADPAALTRRCQMPFGVMSGAAALAIHVADLLVHTWDLGVARDAIPMLDDDLAEFALEVERELITQSMRGDGLAFGPERPVEHDASASARLLAFVGRSVAR